MTHNATGIKAGEMQKNAFTAGPWFAETSDDGTRIYAGMLPGMTRNVVELADVWYPNHKDDRPRDAERAANARLIAAAPTLYEALSDAERAIDSLERDDLGGIFDGHGAQIGTVRDELLAKVRAALSKARGE